VIAARLLGSTRSSAPALRGPARCVHGGESTAGLNRTARTPNGAAWIARARGPS
jgi:hypothetical protein